MNVDDQVLERRLRKVHMPLPTAIREAVLQPRGPLGVRAVVPMGVAFGAPALIAVLLVAVIALSGGIPRRAQPLPGILQVLSSGAPAATGYGSDRQFVWLTGVVTSPAAQGTAQQGRAMDTRAVILDWAGRVRYRFTLPRSSYAAGFNEVQVISADGTRALLADGTVLDEQGKVVGRIAALATGGGPGRNYARWLSDASGVCGVVPSTTGHTLTLNIYQLDGTVRTVASVGSEPIGEPSGTAPDTASVVACSVETDQAVVARYHDYSDPGLPPSHNSTEVSVGLWAVQISTGKLLSHEAEARMALGRSFLFGSQNARLAVEFLWNDRVAGSETDVVLRMPSGNEVPLDRTDPNPDTPAVSGDGTRILRRVVNRAGTQTDLELIDAANGRVIRRVAAKGTFGALAVGLPGGSAFMVEVDGHFALVDGNGGISLIFPPVGTGPAGVDLPPRPGTQG